MPLRPHEILGIAPDASVEEIKNAYRRRAFETHPDRNPDDDGAAFRAVAWAYKAMLTGVATPFEAEASAEPTADDTSGAELVANLVQFVVEQVLQGQPASKIIEWLRQQGCPDSVAKQVEAEVRAATTSALEEEGRRLVLVNGGIIVATLFAAMLLSRWSNRGPLVLVLGWFFYGERVASNLLVGIQALQGRHPKAYSKGERRALGCFSTLILLGVFMVLPTGSPRTAVKSADPPKYAAPTEAAPEAGEATAESSVADNGNGGVVRYRRSDTRALAAVELVRKAELELEQAQARLKVADDDLAEQLSAIKKLRAASDAADTATVGPDKQLKLLRAKATKLRRRLDSLLKRYPRGLPRRQLRRAKGLQRQEKVAVQTFNTAISESRPLFDRARAAANELDSGIRAFRDVVGPRNRLAEKFNAAAAAYDDAWGKLASIGTYSGPRPMVRAHRAEILKLPPLAEKVAE